MAECSEAYEILPKRSEAYAAEQSKAYVSEAERSEVYNILDIGQYNLKRVCSSAKNFEARIHKNNASLTGVRKGFLW